MNTLIFSAAPLADSVIKEAGSIATGSEKIDLVVQNLIGIGIEAGKSILLALIVFIIGRFVISIINKFLAKVLERRHVEATIQTFLKSLVKILLTILLIITVVGTLGVNTTSFAALLASAGVAIGMALSGNLQNLAGGLIILLFKPYRVGDQIEGQGVSGIVSEIQIFHTIVTTFDNRVIYVPNGSMSSSVVSNYNRKETRRIEWIVGVDYGEDIDKVESVLRALAMADERIKKDPAPFIALHALGSSSVNIIMRVWTDNSKYWDVYFDMNKRIYDEFNKENINFPYPQLTLHNS